jgi:hypothetical protein
MKVGRQIVVSFAGASGASPSTKVAAGISQLNQELKYRLLKID